jgi:hypothetical protein
MLPKPLKAPQWASLGFAWSKGKGKMDYTVSHYKLSFWAAASAQRALAAAVRLRPPAGRARPSSLHIKKALVSKWYYLDEYKKHFGNLGALIIRERNGQWVYTG